MIFTYNGDQTTAKSPKEILDDMMSSLISLNEKMSKRHTNMANIEITHYHMYADGTSEDNHDINEELASINTSVEVYFDLYCERIHKFDLSLIKFFDDNNLMYKVEKMKDLSYPYLGKILDNYIPIDNNAGNIERYMVIMNKLEEALSNGITQSDIYAKIINPKCISTSYAISDFEKILNPHFCKLQTGLKFNPEMDIEDLKNVICVLTTIYTNAKEYSYKDLILPVEINSQDMIKFINIIGLFRHFLYSMILSFVTNWNETLDLLEDR